MRRFAEETSVPISRSRGEIDKLLRDWGATGIQWTDQFDLDCVTLQFIWPRDEERYMARFSVGLPSEQKLAPHAVDGRSGRTSERKLAALLVNRGRREHRVLLLWLKAALNAVDAGIVSAETIFLPFLVGRDGRTVAEVAVPRLSQLIGGDASRLLTAHK